MARILITGAGRGVGLGLVETALAAGHDVIGTTRGTGGLPPGAEHLPLDVADPASQAAFAEALSAQTLDWVICNAGVLAGRGSLLNGDTGTPEEWRDTLMTNIAGVFWTVQSVLPALRRSSQGKVAIISSQLGSSTFAVGKNYSYHASKAAALNLGLNMATELKTVGIAVGTYHPGWVKTEMGTARAEISVEESAAGLMDRITALSLETTGCFETWDGRAHPI